MTYPLYHLLENITDKASHLDLVSAVASTGLSGRPVRCSSNEIAVMQPPSSLTCGEYLSAYASASGGEIYNPNATSDCEFCTARVADQFLSSVAISYTTRWRDYGIGFAFIFFNIAAAVLLYYFFRVRKSSGKGVGEKLKPVLGLFRKDPEKKNVGSEKKKAPQDQAEGENLA